ncbi:MAG: acyl-CoA dehydrogenase family protein, partial [Deltaproteobacteria bacterium]|nr:acyl-CoA dehydrogenase family protein [Deltaproteobacteria bacterium]
MDTRIPMIDLYELEPEWTEEQRTAVGQVRRFVDQEVLPIMRQHHEKGEFPKSLVPKIATLGILEEVSTGTIDPTTYGLVLRELERGGSELRSFVSVQGSLVMSALSFFGSDEQKNTWLPRLGSLSAIGCFGLTEHDFGSNPSGMITKATETSHGYLLNGKKCWITNGTMANVAIIWAKLEGRVRAFLVESDRKGFDARSIKGKWSFRASDTAEIFLDNVELPKSALLPLSRSVGSALACLNQARIGIAWGVIGAAAACIDETRWHLLERPQFDGKPLASHQLIQSKLAWMATEITGMQLIAKRLSELKRAGKLEAHHVSLAKMNNCRKALEIARVCRELLGASGIHDEYHVGRHMVNLETVVTYEGTENIHSLVLGHHLTGIK